MNIFNAKVHEIEAPEQVGGTPGYDNAHVLSGLLQPRDVSIPRSNLTLA